MCWTYSRNSFKRHIIYMTEQSHKLNMRRLQPNPEKQRQTQTKVAEKRTYTRNAREQRTTQVKIVRGGRRCKHSGSSRNEREWRSCIWAFSCLWRVVSSDTHDGDWCNRWTWRVGSCNGAKVSNQKHETWDVRGKGSRRWWLRLDGILWMCRLMIRSCVHLLEGLMDCPVGRESGKWLHFCVSCCY